MATISVLKKVSKSQVADLTRLIKKLREGQKPTRTKLAEVMSILKDKNVAVVVALDNRHIIGVASLYIMQKIGKRIACVEDVIVDEAYRRQGLGEKLMRKLIAVAKNKKIGTLGLTSRPERVAGNKLYQKIGFVQKETNSYRLHL